MVATTSPERMSGINSGKTLVATIAILPSMPAAFSHVEVGNAITGSNVKAAERLMALEERQGSAVSLFFRLVIFDRMVDDAFGTRQLYGCLER